MKRRSSHAFIDAVGLKLAAICGANAKRVGKPAGYKANNINEAPVSLIQRAQMLPNAGNHENARGLIERQSGDIDDAAAFMFDDESTHKEYSSTRR